MKKVTLNVSGITCQGCTSAVQAALSNVTDVRRADVSLEQKRARLVLEDAGSMDELIGATQAAGFVASLENRIRRPNEAASTVRHMPGGRGGGESDVTIRSGKRERS